MEKEIKLGGRNQGKYAKLQEEIGEVYDRLQKAHEEIEKLKAQKIEMRKECNRRFSEQLQKIRKLEAEKMLQIQDILL